MAKLMSEALKQELASKLGVEGTVERAGWGAVSSRDCGRLVRAAVEVAEQNLRGNTSRRY